MAEPGSKSIGSQIDRRDKEPRQVLEFFFSAHNTARDFEGLQAKFEACDVYVPEAVERTPEIYQKAVDIAAGIRRPEALDKKTEEWDSNDAEDVMLFNSHKPIIFADLPKGHQLDLIEQESQENILQARETFVGGDFDNAVALAKEHIKKNAEYMAGRDAYIAAELNDTRKIMEAYPELKSKTEIRFLVQLGIAHQSLLRRFSGTSEVIVAQSGAPALVDQIVLKTMAGQEVESEDAAKVILESLLFTSLEHLLQEGSKTAGVFAIIRKIIDPLSLDQIRGIHARVTSAIASDYDMDDTEKREVFSKTVEKMLQIKLPLTREEGELFLKGPEGSK